MPLYLDRHDVVGATPQDLADAHLKDLAIQEAYGVRYITYWFDAKNQTAFCLADAPSAEVAQQVHRDSHGLVANRVIEVDPNTLQDFLGTILESQPGKLRSEGALRTIVFTDMAGSTTLTEHLGDARAMEVLRSHNKIIRDALALTGGREIKHTGDGVMACFSSVVRSAQCAIAIQQEFALQNESALGPPIRVRVGLSAGEPVTEAGDLFGASVQMAARICAAAEPATILASSTVRELAVGKDFTWVEPREMILRGFEEAVRVYQLRW